MAIVSLEDLNVQGVLLVMNAVEDGLVLLRVIVRHMHLGEALLRVAMLVAQLLVSLAPLE